MSDEQESCCGKINCETHLNCKATAEVQYEVDQEMDQKDKPIQEILDAAKQQQSN
jgi:hypothetical protein